MGTEITIETPLAKALTSAGLQQYVKSFDDAGYADLMDLGGDADSVKEAVGEVVPNKPGVTNRILRLWQDAGKPVEKPINTPLAQALTSAGLQTFVKSFDDAGYTDLTELGSDEQAAKAAIATVVKDKPPIASRILALWKDTAKSVETAPIETPLAKALAGANLQAYARSFDDAGYTDLKELGSTEDGANKVIGTVVKDKPGVAQRILDLWKEATKKPGKRDALPLSQLPAGKTVDLTQDTIKIDEVTYSIPSALKVDSPDPKTFAAPDWMVIAKTTKALHGVHVDKALTSFGDEDARAPHAALVWKVPEGDDYLDTNLVSSAKSTMSYTSSLNNLVHNRIIDGSLSIATPFASVAAQASRDEKQAKSQVRKRLYMTGLWRYPMAKLTLGEFIADSDSNEGAHVREGCASLSPKFVAAVDAALAKPSEQRFNALKRVFDDFGHAVPKTVTVGGQLFFQSERDTTGNVNEDQVKNTVSVAADAKYHGVGGSVKASFQDASGAKFEGQEIAETATFAAAGGLRTLASDPAKWAGTLEADPNKWAVIERGGMIPLVEWLDKTRREAVVAAWNAGLKRAWGGFDPPVDYILPDFGGKPFTIATSPAGRKKDYPKGYTQSDRMALHVAAGGKPKGVVEAVAGTLLADPQAHALLFQLVFSGKTTAAGRRGQPLYWLVSDQPEGRYFAASTPTGGGTSSLVCLLEGAGWKLAQPEQSPFAWTITPADPSGYLGLDSDDAHAYLITNFASGRLLGPVKRDERTRQFVVGVGGDAATVKEEEKLVYSWVCTPFDLPARLESAAAPAVAPAPPPAPTPARDGPRTRPGYARE